MNTLDKLWDYLIINAYDRNKCKLLIDDVIPVTINFKDNFNDDAFVKLIELIKKKLEIIYGKSNSYVITIKLLSFLENAMSIDTNESLLSYVENDNLQMLDICFSCDNKCINLDDDVMGGCNKFKSIYKWENNNE